MAPDEADADENAGHAVETAENAALGGHAVTDGDSYVVETGVLVRTLAYHSAEPQEPCRP